MLKTFLKQIFSFYKFPFLLLTRIFDSRFVFLLLITRIKIANKNTIVVNALNSAGIDDLTITPCT